MKYRFVAAFLSFTILSQKACSQHAGTNALISKAIDKHGKAFLNNKYMTSASIGVIQEGDVYIQHFGEIEKDKGKMPDNETIYEIGSVTKTMAGYMVAKAVVAGKIKLEDDVRLYLKEDYPNLEYNNKPITIKHLLTHTSGLPPTLPKGLNEVFEKAQGNVPEEYYQIESSYNKEKFLADLRNLVLISEPGTKYSYSNAGAELIGYILETVYGENTDELFRRHLVEENNMLNTAIMLNEPQKERLVRGYWINNKTPSHNQLNKLWGTGGGVKMNLTDMIGYMELQLNSKDPIVSESHRVLYEEGKTRKIAYFWNVWNDKHGRSYNHHGGTIGTQNWLFIFPKYHLGISIITNQSGPKTPGLLRETVGKILKDIVASI